MKRIFVFFLILFFANINVIAKKSYVTVYCYTNSKVSEYTTGDPYIYLSGDIPTTMKDKYSAKDLGYGQYTYIYQWMGHVTNLLSDNGYTCEQMNTVSYGTNNSSLITIFLFSKDSSDSTSPSYIQRTREENDSDIYEVARYNLQGLPISEREKGIQIIVYSNYTTKTVIKE